MGLYLKQVQDQVVTLWIFTGTHVFRHPQGEAGRSAAPNSPQLRRRPGAFAESESSLQFQIAAATAS